MKTRTRQITRLFGVAMLALALAAGLAPAVAPAIAQQDEAAGEAQAPAAEGEETAETAEGATTENAAEPDAPAIAASEDPAVEHNPYGLKALWDEGEDRRRDGFGGGAAEELGIGDLVPEELTAGGSVAAPRPPDASL